MSAEIDTGPDLAAAAAIDAGASTEPNLEREVAAAMPVPKPRKRYRPLTKDKEKWEAERTFLLGMNAIANGQVDGLKHAARKAKRALMLGLPTALALGALLGRLA